MDIKHKFKKVNGINMHYAEAGSGPLVILLHGFPELWYSWRSQIPAIAKAGYHVVAPDLRGYGQTDHPSDVASYSIVNQIKDIIDLMNALGEKSAVFIGHDWGANLTYAMVMLHPEKVNSMVILSIPFYPQPVGPVSKIKEFSKGRFNFVEHFQQPGLAESEMSGNTRHFFKLFFYALSGNAPDGLITTLFTQKTEQEHLLSGIPEPKALPNWLSEADLDYYSNSFKTTGFTGALNIYRNIDMDFNLLSSRYKQQISQPALFIAGEKDAAVKFGSLDATKKGMTDLKDLVIIPNAGHWIQQEKPGEVNEAILHFLSGNK